MDDEMTWHEKRRTELFPLDLDEELEARRLEAKAKTAAWRSREDTELCLGRPREESWRYSVTVGRKLGVRPPFDSDDWSTGVLPGRRNVVNCRSLRHAAILQELWG